MPFQIDNWAKGCFPWWFSKTKHVFNMWKKKSITREESYNRILKQIYFVQPLFFFFYFILSCRCRLTVKTHRRSEIKLHIAFKSSHTNNLYSINHYSYFTNGYLLIFPCKLIFFFLLNSNYNFLNSFIFITIQTILQKNMRIISDLFLLCDFDHPNHF